jgi:hypothetical protein
MNFEMQDNGTREVQIENGALRENQTGKGRPDLICPFALTRLAKHYENGARKYGDRNYEKGMPFSRYTASMFRHVIAWMKGDESEDHLAAIAWNAFSLMHHQELGEMELDDMPHYLGERRKYD